MKKSKIIIILILIILSVIFAINLINLNFNKRKQYSYSPSKAVEYSYTHIETRNPQFPNFEKNCICYVSQCLVAGGLEMDQKNISFANKKTRIKPTSTKWFCYYYENDSYRPIVYYTSSSFVNNSDFISYWKNYGNINTKTIDNTLENISNLKNLIKIGDIIILHGKYSHAALVVKIDDENIYYNSNTNDRKEYPLSYVDVEKYPKITYMNFVK